MFRNLPLHNVLPSVGLPMQRQQLHEQFACVTRVQTHEKDTEHVTRVKSVEDGWWYTALLPTNADKAPSGLVKVIRKFSNAKTAKALQKHPQHFFDEFHQADLLPDIVPAAATPLRPPLRSPLQPSLLAPFKVVEAGVSRLNQSWYYDTSAKNGKTCIAIGDPAPALDPMSSQGMFFALHSAVKCAVKCAELIINIDASKSYNQTGEFSTRRQHYQQSIDKVLISNEKSRTLMRVSESRFPHSDYWRITP